MRNPRSRVQCFPHLPAPAFYYNYMRICLFLYPEIALALLFRSRRRSTEVCFTALPVLLPAEPLPPGWSSCRMLHLPEHPSLPD